ncbi:MAG: hypothetical protein KME60_18885 [Cyanomargarita calcarea GSE-NOS-MK-12-04C]|jgi:hypothetical protein|uniref:Uncharacterized protein n=1 Tax=Cyanomargarita calcarea GSE-NOS-MK-12-04C TaxID=2839659 RepID=A0A951QNX9_9CYAN|nr:hypothetical protein [Cyanomargarita calcarea GSE-NOS-MK-12-04C]
MVIINDLSHVEEVVSSEENNVLGGLALANAAAGAFAFGLQFSGTATFSNTFAVSAFFNISKSVSTSQSAAQ